MASLLLGMIMSIITFSCAVVGEVTSPSLQDETVTPESSDTNDKNQDASADNEFVNQNTAENEQNNTVDEDTIEQETNDNHGNVVEKDKEPINQDKDNNKDSIEDNNTIVVPNETNNDNENILVTPSQSNTEVKEIPKTSSGTLFSKGITKNAGWTDVDKTYPNGSESNTCWMSASANMISWWQKQHNITIPDSDTKHIYKEIQKQFGNEQGDMIKGLRWYFIGDDSQTTGGHLFKYLSNPIKNWSVVPSLRTAYDYIDNIYGMEQFYNLVTKELQKGVVALALSRFNSGTTQHAVTLWGVEYSNGVITKVYLADSDDLKHQLAEYEVYVKDNRVTLKGYDYYEFIKSVTILYP